MRTYRVRICIESTDKGPSEQSEVVHNVSANGIADLVSYAEEVISAFGAPKETAVAAHDRLVATQNKGADAKPNPK